MGLTIVPLTYREVAKYVADHHRHHAPPPGAKFCIGVADDAEQVVGVAMVGRPVARHFDDGWTLEVNRTCTEGAPNANSALYGAAWRAAKALGYRRLITYTQGGETGASLRATGWRVIGEREPRAGWSCATRPRLDTHPTDVQRTLWEVA